MSLTFGQIRRFFIDGCGEETAAVNEWNFHVTEGLRRVYSLVDVPELYVTTTTTISAGDDFIATPSDCYHVATIVNLTDEYAMHPEPSGMVGRARYIQSDGKPPSGSVTHYFQDGARIYFRDKPSVNTSIQLRYRKEPAAVTEADLDSSPLTPERYDWAIVHAAIRNYYQAHPSANLIDGETHISLSDKAERALQSVLAEPRPSYAETNKPAYYAMRVSGYRMGARRR